MTLLHQFFQFPVCFCTFALYVSLTFCVLSHVYLGTHHDTSCGRLCRKNKYKHWLSCCFILLYHHHILSKIIAQVAAKLVLVSFLVICLNPTSLDAICTQLLIRMKRKLLYGTVDTITGNFLLLWAGELNITLLSMQ